MNSSLKASNLFTDSDGTLKLSDYTISVFTHYLERILDPSSLNGRGLWFAPEVVLDGEYDSRCDIWAVGCLTYELLTSKPPFYGLTNGGDIHQLREIMKNQSKIFFKKNSSNYNSCTFFKKCKEFYESLLQVPAKREIDYP